MKAEKMMAKETIGKAFPMIGKAAGTVGPVSAIRRPAGAGIVTNAADVDRAALALQAFMDVLAADPRVIEAYTQWRAARGLTRLINRVRRRQTAAVVRLFGSAILREHAHDAALLQTLIASLKLSYPWLPSLLLAQWRTWALGEASGQPSRLSLGPHRRPITATMEPGETATTFARRVRALSAATWPTTGRRAISKRPSLVRDVHWYYRARVKQPKDTIRSIAREYAGSVQRHTDARSVVQKGIAHAQEFLGLTCLSPLPK